MSIEKRILIVMNNPLGGVATYVIYNTAFLQKHGIRFTFLAPEGDAFTEFKKLVSNYNDVRFVDAPKKKNNFFIWKTVWKEIKTNKPDLIHSQGLFAGTAVSLATLFSNIPHFITLHDVILPQNNIPGKFKSLKKLIISVLLCRVSKIIPVSNDCAENHLHHFPVLKLLPRKINVINNGIDLSRIFSFEPNNNQNLRTNLGIPKNIVVLGFFGRFMPQKGFEVLFKALQILCHKSICDKFALIITKDLHGYRGEYLRMIRENTEINKITHIVEPVININYLMKQIDVLVMPSLWEACGLLAMEAMVLGTPVIGTNAIGIREVLADTPAIIVEKGNPESLAEAISKIPGSDLKSRAEQFIPNAIERFDNNKSAQELLRLINSFIK
jgi:glycosyltransferase involved in cell wall biosynthesis